MSFEDYMRPVNELCCCICKKNIMRLFYELNVISPLLIPKYDSSGNPYSIHFCEDCFECIASKDYCIKKE